MELRERRSVPRIPLHLVGQFLTSFSSTRQQEVQVKDISSKGAFLVSTQLPEPGERIKVVLNWPERQSEMPLFLDSAGEVYRQETSDHIPGFVVLFKAPPVLVGQFPVRSAGPVPHSLGTPSLFRFHKDNPVVFEYFPQLRAVRDFVTGSYSKEITLTQVARIAAMEKTYFSDFFHKKVGVPFSVWLRQFRISKAMEFIQQEDNSISVIADMCGYPELRTFERAFRKCTDLTPSDFKRFASPVALGSGTLEFYQPSGPLLTLL